MFSLPLKTDESPHGVFSEHELYMVIAVIFIGIFSDLDPAISFPLRHAARAVSQQLGKLVEANVHSVSRTGMVAGVVDRFRENKNPLSDYGVHMIRRLLESGLGVSETTWSQVLPTAVAMVPNQAQVVRVEYPSDQKRYHDAKLDDYSSPSCWITTSLTKENNTSPPSTNTPKWTPPKATTRSSITPWKASASTALSARTAKPPSTTPSTTAVVKSPSNQATKSSAVLYVPFLPPSLLPSHPHHRSERNH